MATFGDILRDRRRVAGISQRDLAAKIGVDFSYISKLENGRLAPPATDTTGRIAKALNCAVEDLLAAAGKFPSGVEDAIASEPAAIRFLQKAVDLDLTQSEWERMLSRLESLRGQRRG
jgi:transcriptional regulator with XRE-family HTH domain